MDEGVIKFRLHFVPRAPPPTALVQTLEAWRRVLHRLGLVGRDADRYGGHGYGNLSRRLPAGGGDGFVITGSQTGGLARMGGDAYSLVRRCDLAGNEVYAEGRVPPSSEALTHAAVYALDPSLAYVFHVHSASCWCWARRLGLPVTRPEVAYGTPAMAREVARLYGGSNLEDGGVFAMGGHEDGLVGFGRSAEQAGCGLVSILARAHGIEIGAGSAAPNELYKPGEHDDE